LAMQSCCDGGLATLLHSWAAGIYVHIVHMCLACALVNSYKTCVAPLQYTYITSILPTYNWIVFWLLQPSKYLNHLFVTSRMCCASCTGFLSGDTLTTRLHAWCSSRSLVWHPHIWLMTSTLSPTAATTFCSRQDMSSHVHTTPLMTGVSVLPVRGCGTIYRLSCDRTATDNSNDKLKTFLLGIN